MIPIRNLFHMLAYAFHALREDGFRDVEAEEFSGAADLLAWILCRGLTIQLKRGLPRNYLLCAEPLSKPRGKFLLSESVRTLSVRRREWVCEFDEFSEDSPMNRIFKAAMRCLLRQEVTPERRQSLRRLLFYFNGVRDIPPKSLSWNVRLNRNQQTCGMLLEISRMILENLIQASEEGTRHVRNWLDDQTMARLFEKFLLAYFRREHTELRTTTPSIKWRLDGETPPHLPAMQTDLVLRTADKKKTLILDAKFYSKNMQIHSLYQSRTIHSANLYQIFAYVKNWPAAAGEEVSGMLLYARTDHEIQPDLDCRMAGNRILVRTLDLNLDFPGIRTQLDQIAKICRE